MPSRYFNSPGIVLDMAWERWWRDEMDELLALGPAAENSTAEDARRERAAVVAWLREVLAEASLPLGVSQVFDAVVDTIESGEHRREGE